MPDLNDLQKQFLDYLVVDDCDLATKIENPPQGTIEERMLIYGEAYFLRLIDILAEDFPGIKAVLGEEDFQKLAMDYLNQNPPRHYSPNFVGAKMIAFLEEINQPDLKEMAILEWSISNTIGDADAKVLLVDDLQTIPEEKWGELTFSLHPSVHLMQFVWNVLEVRQATNAEEPLPDLRQSAPRHCLAWRSGIKTCARYLENEEAFFLHAAQEGKNFGEICEGLCEWVNEDEAAEKAINLLILFISDELFVNASAPHQSLASDNELSR